MFGVKRDDPARGWHGITPDGLPVLRMLYVGDCGFRQMENAHDLHRSAGPGSRLSGSWRAALLIHLGGTYHRKLTLGMGKRMQQLRHDFGKRLGRKAFAY